MKNKKETYDKMKLRSERVRKLVGKLPPNLIRWGYAIMIIIFVMMLLALFCISYPYGNGETIFQYFFHSK